MLISLISGNFSVMNAVIYFLSSCMVIFGAMPVHELAHAYTAHKLGDNTAKWQGRLSFNPFAHIDYLGALMIILFGFGWAKPVEINTLNFKKPKLYMAISALAGPVSNLIMAFLSSIISGFVVFLISKGIAVAFLTYLFSFFMFFTEINISLAVFNLVPIPPLDGSKLLFSVLPDRIYFKILQYENFFIIAIIALCYFGSFSDFIGNVSYAIANRFVAFGINLFQLF